MTDTDRIAQGIDAARNEQREIDDTTARIIAAQWHLGIGSDTYAFVSTGAIVANVWFCELLPDYPRATAAEREHLDRLGTYFFHHGPRGPVAGWAESTRY